MEAENVQTVLTYREKNARTPLLFRLTRENRFKLDRNAIKTDLENDLPLYILSAYGPGRDAPQQLFGGQPREQSFEELRLRHYELSSAGNEAQAIQEAQLLYSNAEQQIKNALHDLDGAIKYITNAANQHPNRLDICRGKGEDVSQQQQLPTGPRSTTGAFTRGSAFGQPSFGQPSAPAPAPAPAFGKPSFGQAAAPPPTFGQATILGQQSMTSGQPPNLAPATAPAFGPSFTSSPFGQPQQAAKPFGLQQSQQQPIFGQSSSPFGQQSSTGPQITGAFGQQTSANTFEQSAAHQSSGTLGQPPTSHTTASSFGSKDSGSHPRAFGQQTPATAPAFGEPAAPMSTGIFGRPSASSTSTGFAPSSVPAVSGGSSGPALPSISPTSGVPTNATFGPGKPGERKLLTWQGHEVDYIDDEPCVKIAGDGEYQRIWFPEGPPTFTSKTQEYPDGYVLDEAARENLKHFLQHGVGSDGLIPDLPPPRDMLSWNF
ncbi:MAG: hypothetical protein Q9171_000080 [Xanthocarpia ochracea]